MFPTKFPEAPRKIGEWVLAIPASVTVYGQAFLTGRLLRPRNTSHIRSETAANTDAQQKSRVWFTHAASNNLLKTLAAV
jgi:hypothetical protein